jgi:hypothetical protein
MELRTRFIDDETEDVLEARVPCCDSTWAGGNGGNTDVVVPTFGVEAGSAIPYLYPSR